MSPKELKTNWLAKWRRILDDNVYQMDTAMCGRLSQYSGIHDFVAALSMPNALANSVGDLPLERYNVAPTTQVALLHLQDNMLHADPVRWD